MKHIKNAGNYRDRISCLVIFALAFGVPTLWQAPESAAQKRVSPSNASTISGTSVGRGITCPRFRLKSGETISLTGRKRSIRSGKRYKLRGKWAAFSNCMQGRTFAVEEIVTER